MLEGFGSPAVEILNPHSLGLYPTLPLHCADPKMPEQIQPGKYCLPFSSATHTVRDHSMHSPCASNGSGHKLHPELCFKVVCILPVNHIRHNNQTSII